MDVLSIVVVGPMMPNASSYHRRNQYILLYSHLSPTPPDSQTWKTNWTIVYRCSKKKLPMMNGIKVCPETLQAVCMRVQHTFILYLFWGLGWAKSLGSRCNEFFNSSNRKCSFPDAASTRGREKSRVSAEMFHTTNSLSFCSSKVLRSNSSRFASSSGDFTLGLEAITTMLLRIWTPKTVNSVSNVSRSRMVSLAMLSKTKNFRHLAFASATATATRCAASSDVNRSLVSKQPGVSRSGPRIESNNSGYSVTDSPLPSPTAGHFSSIDLRSWQTMVDLAAWLGPKRINAWAPSPSESPQKGERLPVPAAGGWIRPSRRSSCMGWLKDGWYTQSWETFLGDPTKKQTLKINKNEDKIMEDPGWLEWSPPWPPTRNLPTEACTPRPLLSSPLLWHSHTS